MLHRIMNKNLTLIMFLTLITLQTSCSKKKEKQRTFDFEYLKSESSVLNDSMKLKLNLYFDNMSLVQVNDYLSDIQKYKSIKKDTANANFLSFLKSAQGMDNVPNRLKRIKVTDENWYNDFLLDSLFYQNIEIEYLVFTAKKYYDHVNNLKLTQKHYEENINTAIVFKYDHNQPITFINNRIKFNMYFSNSTSKEIEEFSGTIFICDSKLNILYQANLNSNVLPLNIKPDPLKPAKLDLWEYRILNTYQSDINELRVDVSNYQKEQLRRNYKEMQLIFIPKKVYFTNGTSLFQS